VCQHFLAGMADRGFADGLVLEQAFHHLAAHFPVEAVDRLRRGVARHAQDTLRIVGDEMAGLVGPEDDLRTAENQPHGQCGQQNHSQESS